MNLDELYSELTLKTGAKLALVVLDGLGDLATTGGERLLPGRAVPPGPHDGPGAGSTADDADRGHPPD